MLHWIWSIGEERWMKIPTQRGAIRSRKEYIADLINKRKEEFYEKYEYLRPECDKSWLEKAGEWISSAGQWCKEHIVTLVTVIVVIAIAAVAAICGVAIAAIAAIAGLVALLLTVADVICMAATGKDIATMLRDNGLDVLADIFQGVSIGSDIVSIVFPVGAALKTMAKVGVKAFAKGSIAGIKAGFKESIDNVFRSGFKNGLKNAGKILIFDIDDLTKIKDGKRVFNLMEETVKMEKPYRNWVIDNNQLIPSSEVKPGKFNPNDLTMEEIMNQDKFSKFQKTISYKNGYPDMSPFAVAEVNIKMTNPDSDTLNKYISGSIGESEFSYQLRDRNYKSTYKQLELKYNKSFNDFKKQAGYQLTIHEDLNMKKCFLVPTEIHANVGHTGGVANYKFIFNSIPNANNIIGHKLLQFEFRFKLDKVSMAAN
jgi:hypothetical protein